MRGVQQLSCMSRRLRNVLPRVSVPDHSVEDRKELAHASDEGDLLKLACGEQALVQGANHRVMASGDKRSHVEHCPDCRPATPNYPPAFEFPAVPRQRRCTHQLRDLAAIKPPQLRHAANKAGRKGRAHAFCATQDAVFLAPAGIGFYRLTQLLLDAGQTLLKPAEMGLDFAANLLRCGSAAILLGREHAHQLPPPDDQGVELLGGFARQGSRRRLDHLGEVGKNAGIDLVGLLEVPGSFGEIADLARIGDRKGELGSGKRQHKRKLVATCRFDHNQGRSQTSQALKEVLDAGFVVGARPNIVTGSRGNVELALGDVYSNEDLRRGHAAPFWKQSLCSRPFLRDSGSKPSQLCGLWQNGRGRDDLAALRSPGTTEGTACRAPFTRKDQRPSRLDARYKRGKAPLPGVWGVSPHSQTFRCAGGWDGTAVLLGIRQPSSMPVTDSTADENRLLTWAPCRLPASFV